MKRLFVRRQLSTVFTLIAFFGTLLTVVLVGLHQSEGDLSTFIPRTVLARTFQTTNDSYFHTTLSPVTTNPTSVDKTCTTRKKATHSNCIGCRQLINKALKDYSFNWTKNKENHKKLRSLLNTNCNGFKNAFVTKTNSHLGTTIAFDGAKWTRKITEYIFNRFPKDAPFSDKLLDTCAVVGNGGILTNSSCGEAIDSAHFVIRCNLPPLGNNYSKHVGKKTSLVTANPSIFIQNFDFLHGRRRPFADDVRIYGDALLLLPAFSFPSSTDISMKVHNTLEDFRSSVKAVFMNPNYLRSLDKFWRLQGVKPGKRMSSGFMMVSLALEICKNVDLYGFWPFGNHPFGFQSLSNHYYDDVKQLKDFHDMPAEFAHLIKLHNQGVLKLHVGDCLPP